MIRTHLVFSFRPIITSSKICAATEFLSLPMQLHLDGCMYVCTILSIRAFRIRVDVWSSSPLSRDFLLEQVPTPWY
jgi:hypothetical protein